MLLRPADQTASFWRMRQNDSSKIHSLVCHYLQKYQFRSFYARIQRLAPTTHWKNCLFSMNAAEFFLSNILVESFALWLSVYWVYLQFSVSSVFFYALRHAEPKKDKEPNGMKKHKKKYVTVKKKLQVEYITRILQTNTEAKSENKIEKQFQ